jgi:hypothetical protein
MSNFSVRFDRCFRYTVEAATADEAVEKIRTAYQSIDYNLNLGLAEKVANAAGEGVEFVDFFGNAVFEEELSEDDDEAEKDRGHLAPIPLFGGRRMTDQDEFFELVQAGRPPGDDRSERSVTRARFKRLIERLKAHKGMDWNAYCERSGIK